MEELLDTIATMGMMAATMVTIIRVAKIKLKTKVMTNESDK